MSNQAMITTILAVVFVAAALLAGGVLMLLRRSALMERIERLGDGVPAASSAGASDAPGGWTVVVSKVAQPFARLSQPKEGWEESELRRRFVQAGWRDPSAVAIFYGLKTLLGLGLPALFLYASHRFGWAHTPLQTTVLTGCLLAAGFLGPNFVLDRCVAARQREIFESFPDALDLLTICVEAGLGLDAAIARVAAEIRLESVALADELELVTLEMRAGAGKERALRNLAFRSGVEDIESLVALLVQSQRFGTSVGESLRIQSDMLRVKRQQRAEEAAGKIAVKLVFPLVLCLLPSIFIVVGGPAMLQIAKNFAELFGAN